jgi:tetratricopeptide (TPR) repeat protein
MNKRLCVIAAVAALAIGNVCWAIDTVKTAKSTLAGRIVAISPVKIDLEQGASGSTAKEIPVDQVQTVFFETEPTELRTAKTHLLGGHYAEALAALERIKADDSGRPEVRQDIDFYKALCAAKMAMTGNGKIADAGRMMKSFADENRKSYHYFEASETVGDLLMAVGQYAPAAAYYGRLDQAPWPDYQMRASVAAGRAILAQGKIDDAQAAFDRVIAIEASDAPAQRQRTFARLGKAAALAAAKRPAESLKIVEDILQTADPEDSPLLARAYNVLGTAYRQGGQTTEALLAFLHVDLLYPTVPDAHAEALANLAELWGLVRRTQRAERARQTLQEEYPDSPWTKKAAGP